ncbi:MAG: sulfite reductase, dissimilatory-type subunit alpha [Desulfitibacter sp. BRH_c19]|nr:MAG: sulfite reductase, dissimilatory-type subunit alpha [Desulfitibacter sp. BRH_c19]
MTENKRPMLDELKKGKWPSFVKEIEKMEDKNAATKDLLGLLETSFEDNSVHWKHGGIVGVTGYGGGVIGRYSDLGDKYPSVAEFHTMRVNQPSGWFYSSETLRNLCDIWEKHGSGLTNMHGATGDAILLGTTTPHLQPCFNELSNSGFDLGGSGSNLRSPSCCAGMARCENACIDTMDLCHDLTNEFQDYLHRPMWPYKSKIKISGCANDCVSSIARADLSLIGTWRDNIRIDQEQITEYGKSGYDILNLVVKKCPSKCISFNQETFEFKVDDENCVRCMHCINKMPKGLRIGKDTGVTILIGGKATLVQSAFLSWVLVPFMKVNKEDGYAELKDLFERIWDWWDENAKVRERVGELIYRKGMRTFLKEVGLEPKPQMVKHPRANPYFFWWPEELEEMNNHTFKQAASDAEVK